MTVIEATTTAVMGLGIGAATLLASETEVANGIGNGWMNLVGGLTSLGFAVWYAYFVTTKILPERDRLHAETIGTLTTQFRLEIKEQREQFHEHTEKIVEAIEKLGGRQ